MPHQIKLIKNKKNLLKGCTKSKKIDHSILISNPGAYYVQKEKKMSPPHSFLKSLKKVHKKEIM